MTAARYYQFESDEPSSPSSPSSVLGIRVPPRDVRRELTAFCNRSQIASGKLIIYFLKEYILGNQKNSTIETDEE